VTGAASIVRVALWAAIGASLVMLAERVLTVRGIVRMPGGSALVAEAAGVLLVSAAAAGWFTSKRAAAADTALLAGTAPGVAGAAIQIAHVIQETLIDLGPAWNAVSTFGLLLCTFALWAFAGYGAARRSRRTSFGAAAGCWSAVVTMSLLVAFGFVIEFYLAVPRPEQVVTWGEFQRSGWTDVPAFAVANSLDSAVSHLVIGTVAGTAFGTVAALFARARRAREPGGEAP
jgi:hypothetical protein